VSTKLERISEATIAVAPRPPLKPPDIKQRGHAANITGNVVWEWREYVVSAEGADELRVGTETVLPIVPARFLIRFENRLGYSRLQPLRLGRSWGPARQVEVASAKLGEYEAYRSFTEALIRELYRFGAEKVFDLTGHTSTGMQGPSGARSLLFCMHYLLQKRVEILTNLEFVCERPHLSLSEQRGVRRLAAISRGAKDLIDGLLRGRHSWDRAGHLTTGAALGGFLPSHVEITESAETADNPENRFVLGLAETIASLLWDLQRAPWWRCIPRARRTALLELGHAMDRSAAHPVFEDVGAMRGVPAQSRVLTRSEGYRQLYEVWAVLHQAITPLLTHIEHAIELRKVDVLYEQWCFFELAERIGALLGAAPRFPAPLGAGQLPWKAKADYPCGHSLLYNATRTGYSLPFRPDLLWCAGECPLAVFDAKFRAELPKAGEDPIISPRRADLDKMHAYRDALGVASATVLYPGSESRWFGADGTEEGSPSLQRLLAGSGGVGILSFRPEIGDGH
jgi:uncharacterized protein